MKDLYSLLLSGREQDSQRYWVIFGVMNVINGGLFGLAASNITPVQLKIVSSLLGIGLCILWILGVLRMSEWVKWWERKLELIESQYLSTIKLKSQEDAEYVKNVHVFRNRKGAVTNGCSTRSLGVWIPSIYIVAWVSLLLFTTIPLVCQQLAPPVASIGAATNTVERDSPQTRRLSPLALVVKGEKMTWESILVGFALGLLATLIGVRLQRSWEQRDDKRFRQKVLESLVVEIQNGLARAKGLIEMRNKGDISFGRIYVALWDSVNQRLAGSLEDGEVLNLLHQIYYRFDLINFNFDKDRPGASGAFAETYASEIESNLKLLKNRIGMKDKGDGSI